MTPITNRARLRLAVMVVTSVTLGACNSSDSDSGTPLDDQPGVSGIPSPVPDSDGSTDGDVGAGTGDGVVTPEQGSGAAGGGTEDSSGVAGLSGQALNLGLVQIDQDTDDPLGGSVFGGFFRANLPVPAEQLVSAIVPQEDTCSITRSEDVEGGLPGMGSFDPDITFIDAGDALVLSSPDGTWLTMPRQEQFGFILYEPENDELPLPVPTNLVLDVPGAEFPAFSNVSVPNVTPLTGVMVEGSNTFRWNAGAGDPSVFIFIELFGFVAGSGSISVDCIARDDGEFTLPADIQSEIGPDFPSFPTLDRVGTRAVQLNDSVLLVMNSSSGNI